MTTATPVRRVRRATTTPEVQSHEEVVNVYRTVVGASPDEMGEERREVLAVRKFSTEPAYVRVSAGVTKKTAPYEALRIDVSISVPCYMEEIDEVYGQVSDMVASRLELEVNEYLGEE